MIFLGGSVANFKKGFANITVPSVLTTLVSDELDFPNLSMVGVDDRAAAYTAVDYLIQQGHRKIAVLGGPVTSYPSVMRREGAQQAMQDAGILFSDKLYGLSNYDFESAYHAVNSLLARRRLHRPVRHERCDCLRCHPRAGERRAAGAGGCFGDRL